MEKIILIIEEQLKIVIEELSKKNEKKEELINQKNTLEDFIYLIKLYNKYNLKRKNILDVFSIPYMEDSGYSEYRVINDYETENKEYWKELKINNELVRLYPEDIIIKKK